jgi:glycosyltransferase involved in cell wall biosynthesis
MMLKISPLSEGDLMKDWGNYSAPLVSVTCITFNHENYIEESIKSILAQRTNFPFEVIIHDDASTDKTQEIIKKYASLCPNVIIPILQKENHWLNKGINATTTIVWPNARGKYIAWIEGDDYWTDPYKLQKQVNFLEANPDFGMVHTNVNVVDSSNNVIFASDTNKPSGDVFYDLLKSAFIVTCSTCFRRDIIHEILDYAKIHNVKCAFDYWLWLHIAMRTKIHYMPEITSAYRSHSGGVSKGGGGFFKEFVPLAVLDAVSSKLTYFPERNLNKKWELYINYCRALTASALSWQDRKIYFKFLLNKPIFFFAFFPALWRKIKLRFSKKKS